MKIEYDMKVVWLLQVAWLGILFQAAATHEGALDNLASFASSPYFGYKIVAFLYIGHLAAWKASTLYEVERKHTDLHLNVVSLPLFYCRLPDMVMKAKLDYNAAT